MRRRAAKHGPAPGSPLPGAGNTDRFRQLILPHLDGAYNLARFLTRDPALSEDVVQDAILRAFRAFGQFRGGSPRAWLFAIVRNCARSAVMGGAGHANFVVHEGHLSEGGRARLNDYPYPGPTPEEEVSRKADISRVHAAIEAIPEPFREAIVLRDLEDLSYAEIATVTGVAIGTVMSRLSRGRSMLAEQLLPLRNSDSDQSRSVK